MAHACGALLHAYEGGADAGGAALADGRGAAVADDGVGARPACEQRSLWISGQVAPAVAALKRCYLGDSAAPALAGGVGSACSTDGDAISAPFPPAVARRPLLSAQTAVIECGPGLRCGVKSARRAEQDAVMLAS